MPALYNDHHVFKQVIDMITFTVMVYKTWPMHQMTKGRVVAGSKVQKMCNCLKLIFSFYTKYIRLKNKILCTKLWYKTCYTGKLCFILAYKGWVVYRSNFLTLFFFSNILF